ncbi:MAG: hypothetical protein EAX96_01595 [Candidatus Lokiarchaeota archaeon]|nr:hypothetical protein [Candidatus Lokiarchaeota archaeon]
MGDFNKNIIKSIVKEIYFIQKNGNYIIDIKFVPISTTDEAIVSGLLYGLLEYGQNVTQFLPKNKILQHVIFLLENKERYCISFAYNSYFLIIISGMQDNSQLNLIEEYLASINIQFQIFLKEFNLKEEDFSRIDKFKKFRDIILKEFD